MGTGLILLALIALLVTWLVTKGRRRIGLGVNSKFYVVTFLLVVFIALAAWSSAHN